MLKNKALDMQKIVMRSVILGVTLAMISTLISLLFVGESQTVECIRTHNKIILYTKYIENALTI